MGRKRHANYQAKPESKKTKANKTESVVMCSKKGPKATKPAEEGGPTEALHDYTDYCLEPLNGALGTTKQRITASHNEFALNILRRMTEESKTSVVYSPSSASFALAALLVGAEGDTKHEIRQLLAKGTQPTSCFSVIY